MDTHEIYMYRCIELAQAGSGRVAPNPMVGSVLVYNGRIIGEGYHKMYGKAHAEVNCINSVREEDRNLISASTLYVSLEPCAHFGKTPPCADLIIRHSIPEVIVGIRDPFKQVNGKGIEKLRDAGVRVTVGVLARQCYEINKRFFTFHTLQRPYIILKWAESANHRIANADLSRVMISNDLSNRLVHKWRSEEQSIMIGANTALHDDPSLTTRLWRGTNPVRLVLDPNRRLPSTLRIFDGTVRTIVFNKEGSDLPFHAAVDKEKKTKEKEESEESEESAEDKDKNERTPVEYYRLEKHEPMIPQILDALYTLGIQSVLVEGGATLINSFIESDTWDEARIIRNSKLMINNGLPAPYLVNGIPERSERLKDDSIDYFKNKEAD